MAPINKIASSAAVVATIAVAIILTFWVARHVDGDVEAAPIVSGAP